MLWVSDTSAAALRSRLACTSLCKKGLGWWVTSAFEGPNAWGSAIAAEGLAISRASLTTGTSVFTANSCGCRPEF